MPRMPMQNWIKIRELRLEAQLSRSRLARLANLDRATVTKAETERPITDLSTAKIAIALSASLEREIVYTDLLLTDDAEELKPEKSK